MSSLSQLSPVPGPHNLQALKDLVLEAPFEWRVQLEEMIEAYEEWLEDEDDVEEAQAELEELREACKDAIKEVRTELDSLTKMKVRNEASFKVSMEIVEKALKDLDEASDEPAEEHVTQKPTHLEIPR